MLSLSLVGCGDPNSPAPSETPTPRSNWTVSDWILQLDQESTQAVLQLPQIDPLEVTGDLKGVGSSTLFPLTQVIYERFVETGYQGVLDLNSSGTEQGFQLFCEGEADFVNASRSIQPSEVALCQENGLDPVEFGVGLDAVALVVNPANSFIQDVNFRELQRIFLRKQWADVNPQWPNEPIYRYMPDPSSETLRFFLEAVMEGEPLPTLLNTEFTPDQTALIEGISITPLGVGLVSHAYYQRHQTFLNLATINQISLDLDSVTSVIQERRYPLIRPLFLYTDLELVERKPQLYAFLNFYLSTVDQVVEEAGYFPAKDLLEESKLQFIDGLNLESLINDPSKSTIVEQRTKPDSWVALQTKRHQIEVAIQPMAEQIAQDPIQPDEMFNRLREYLESSPSIFAAAFGFNPRIRTFSPYLFRANETLSIRDLAIRLDYANEAPWYVDPVEQERPLWSDPYFDASGAGRSVLVTTYSIPVYTPNQDFIGVLTNDLFLASIEASSLEARKLKVVEASTRVAKQLQQLESLDPDQVREELKTYLNAYPYLFAAGFAISPQIQKTAPYLYRTSDGLQYVDWVETKNDVLESWFADGLGEKGPIWSEPYFNLDWQDDRKELLMVSLSQPVYKRKTDQRLGILFTHLLLQSYE